MIPGPLAALGGVAPLGLILAVLGVATLGLGIARRQRALLSLAVLVLALCVAEFSLYRPGAPGTCAHRGDERPSAESPFEEAGQLGEHGAWELVFHTKREAKPWVEIDLGEAREIRQITLRQRTDCCEDRGLPLVIETAGADRVYEELERRKDPFREWTFTFTPRTARYVRLRSTKRTILHYRDVVIR